MLPRFHTPELSSRCGLTALSGTTAHHAIHVLRLPKGAPIILFDGHGQEATAEIVSYAAHTLQVNITNIATITRETPVPVTLVQALPSGDKMDWIVEKCTELGVAKIQPVQAARSVSKLNDARAMKKQARWQHIAIAACAQCGRNVVPEVLPLQSLQTWLDTPRDTTSEWRLLMDLAPDLPRLSQFDFGADIGANIRRPITVLIGPEGAFTDAEISAVQGAGFLPINLGPRILRTETAGIAFMAGLNALRGDF